MVQDRRSGIYGSSRIGRLTLRKPTYFHNKQSRGGAPPSISVVLYPICMKFGVHIKLGLIRQPEVKNGPSYLTA